MSSSEAMSSILLIMQAYKLEDLFFFYKVNVKKHLTNLYINPWLQTSFLWFWKHKFSELWSKIRKLIAIFIILTFNNFCSQYSGLLHLFFGTFSICILLLFSLITNTAEKFYIYQNYKQIDISVKTCSRFTQRLKCFRLEPINKTSNWGE